MYLLKLPTTFSLIKQGDFGGNTDDFISASIKRKINNTSLNLNNNVFYVKEIHGLYLRPIVKSVISLLLNELSNAPPTTTVTMLVLSTVKQE